ncbi:MAG: hypothetical protein ABIH22_03210, partial [Candidatus Margulisiibacteriota bacterium]
MAASFPKAVRFNPYPKQWRLPGDKTPSRQHLPAIKGAARRCIAQALTVGGISPAIDSKIDRLPSEGMLQALNPLRQNYLSFTAYSLKQMVAAGTVSAETAWTLFYGEWDKIEEVEEGNFIGMRKAFVDKARADGNSGVDLQRFEFLARGGEAGLAQYERYQEWAGKLVFDEKSCKDMPEAVKEEYRKALWLEMRLIEGQVGIRGLNNDIGVFMCRNGGGAYYDSYNFEPHRVIEGSIDIYNKGMTEQTGEPIDATIKAEIGHWMFGLLALSYSWV